MNYYEELGVTPSASAAEIRQAYKWLARLLHPDRQCDEQLRKVAELQMMRLNDMLAVLIDPPRRERYDASIRMAVVGPQRRIDPGEPGWKQPHLGPIRIPIGAIGWSMALVLGAVALSFTLLYFEHGSGITVYQGDTARRTRASPASPSATQASPERSAPVPRGRRFTKRAAKASTHDSVTIAGRRQESQPATQHLTQHVTQPAPSPTEEARPNPTQIPEKIRTPDTTIERTAPRRSVAARCPFVGTWLYAKSGRDENLSNGLTYRPEYIEMVVNSEERGKVFGRYLGRFPITDQALSSEISFTFHGMAEDGTAVLPWRTSDGGEGQVRMKIVSDVEMEVSWYTTRFGATRKLASGSAVLHRD